MKRLLIIFLALIIAFSFSACKQDEPVGYEMKIATEMLDDGWLYYIYNEQALDEDSDNYIQYGAYNLKYKKIEGYVIPIKDSNTGETVEFAESSLPYLFLKPDENFQNELSATNDYLNELELAPINDDTLDLLNLKLLDENHIVKLFNQMIESPIEDDGKYGYLPEADIVQEALINGYQWQVGYFIASGNIKYIRIDILIDEKDYLSDLYSAQKASEEQINLYEQIMTAEQSIIEKQSFISDVELTDTESYSVQRLTSLLQKIENGEY